MYYTIIVLDGKNIAPFTIEKEDYKNATDESLGKALKLAIDKVV